MAKPDFLTRQNRDAISIRLHPRSHELIELLMRHTEKTRTNLLEEALWEAFDKKLICSAKQHAEVAKELRKE